MRLFSNFLMQEIFRNERIREIYNEYFYQENVKKLSGIFFGMMQEDIIKSSDPLLLANEFFSPLFFYQMQVSLLKLDKKSTSSVVSLFEKHVDYFWDNIKVEKQAKPILGYILKNIRITDIFILRNIK